MFLQAILVLLKQTSRIPSYSWFVISALVLPVYSGKRLKEFRQRLDHQFESANWILLHCFYSMIIAVRLKFMGIQPSKFIVKRFLNYRQTFHVMLLKVIRLTPKVNGLREKLKELFEARGETVEYESVLNEVVGVHFVHYELAYRVVRVETSRNPIISPSSQRNKSCDILADGGDAIYVECKKNLVQDLRPREKIGEGKFESFTPIAPYEIRRWLRNKIDESNKKGADILLVRVPIWTSMSLDREAKYREWANEVFENPEEISFNRYRVNFDGLNSPFTKRVYFVSEEGNIEISII